MKTFILTVILYSTLSASGQEAFRLGRTYRQGWVVWYPENNPIYYYKSIPITFTARTTPDKDPLNWKKANEEPAPVETKSAPAPTVDLPTYARQSTVDSLLNQIRSAQAKQDSLATRSNLFEAALNLVLANVKGLSSDVKVLKQEPDADTLTVSQSGIPLIYRANNTLNLRSVIFAPGSGLVGKIVNGDLVIDRK